MNVYLTQQHFYHPYDVNKLMLFHDTSVYLFSDASKIALSDSKSNLTYCYKISD